MSELDSLFPRALSRPITVREAWNELKVIDKSHLKLTPLYSRYWQQTKPGKSIGKLQATKKLDFGRPSFTVIKSEGNGGLYHPSECRMLDLCEFTRIASYPDSFKWINSRKGWQERIGNSVPPLFLRAIALQIRHILFGGPLLMPYPKTMSYLEILESAWQDHLKPREPDAPTVISTFAGGWRQQPGLFDGRL